MVLWGFISTFAFFLIIFRHQIREGHVASCLKQSWRGKKEVFTHLLRRVIGDICLLSFVALVMLESKYKKRPSSSKALGTIGGERSTRKRRSLSSDVIHWKPTRALMFLQEIRTERWWKCWGWVFLARGCRSGRASMPWWESTSTIFHKVNILLFHLIEWMMVMGTINILSRASLSKHSNSLHQIQNYMGIFFFYSFLKDVKQRPFAVFGVSSKFISPSFFISSFLWCECWMIDF